MNDSIISDIPDIWYVKVLSDPQKGWDPQVETPLLHTFLKQQWSHPFPLGTHKQGSLVYGDTSCGYLGV